SVPEPKPSETVQPLDPMPVPRSDAPEEDIGTKVDSTNPPAKPSTDSPPAKPVVTNTPAKPVIEPAPRSDPPKTKLPKPPETEVEPARRSRPVADTYRPSGAGIYERLLKSSVMVLRKDETGTRAARGSGSLVNREHKLVLTNYHVVGDANEVFVTFPVYEKG